MDLTVASFDLRVCFEASQDKQVSRIHDAFLSGRASQRQ